MPNVLNGRFCMGSPRPLQTFAPGQCIPASAIMQFRRNVYEYSTKNLFQGRSLVLIICMLIPILTGGQYPDSGFYPDSGLSQSGTDSCLHLDGSLHFIFSCYFHQCLFCCTSKKLCVFKYPCLKTALINSLFSGKKSCRCKPSLARPYLRLQP